MSVSIEVSYEQDTELLAVTHRLADLPLKVSRKAYHKPGAKFHRVYMRGEVVAGGSGTGTVLPVRQGKRPGKRRCNGAECMPQPNT